MGDRAILLLGDLTGFGVKRQGEGDDRVITFQISLNAVAIDAQQDPIARYNIEQSAVGTVAAVDRQAVRDRIGIRNVIAVSYTHLRAHET